MEDRGAYWRHELAYPGGLSRDTTGPIDGFYRRRNVKTKPDWPVAVWQDTAGNVWVQVGHATPALEGSDKWWDFLNWSFKHCEAVTQEEYVEALESGIWRDFKTSRNPTTAVFTDYDTFIDFIKGDADVRALAQKKANAYVKDRIAAPGIRPRHGYDE